jgi:CRISPR-associated protein Cas1
MKLGSKTYMNPLHLGGFGVEIQASNAKPHAELMITDGRRNGSLQERHLILPRRMQYDSIVCENATGHISLGALRWLSKHNIPIFFLDFDGSIISQILPPVPVKADLRVAQIQAANDPDKAFTVAKALVAAKLTRNLQVLKLFSQEHDVRRQMRLAASQAMKLRAARTIGELRNIEGKVAQRYWEAFGRVMPEELRFQGRASNSRNDNAVDPLNASLNYSYGYLKVEVRMAINSVGLDAGVGYLHQLSPMQTRESLTYDLMEPFRFLCDLSVIEAFQDGALGRSDFLYTKDDYRFRIEDEARRRLRYLLKQTFNATVEYEGRRLKWGTVIAEKAAELGRYLTQGRPELDFSEPAPILG